jgi:mono/diheme cytochrome c family protein
MAKLPEFDLDLKLPKPPFWLIAGFLVMVIVSWIPLALIARARVSRSPQPRVHLFLDMDAQPKKKAQTPSPVFADGRAMRGRIAGTVARGELQADDHLYRGYRVVAGDEGQAKTEFIDGFPEQIEVDRQFLKRGQAQFNTFCYPCHGRDGYGNGPVTQRAMTLTSGSTWIPPTNLHMQTIRDRSDGYLFFIIGNGVRNMPAYGSQIDVKDRWSIVAYMRALQLAEEFPEQALSAEQKKALGPMPKATQPQPEQNTQPSDGE